jgi:hypothetical protein
MIKKNKILKSALCFAGSTMFLLGFAFPVLAETAGANTPLVPAETLSKIIARSDAAITARIDALNKRLLRINEMKKVSDSEKGFATAQVQKQIDALTTLKIKIDADTDIATARDDAKKITENYRIYALIIPQMSIIASADRISIIVDLVTTLETKLQSRITDAQNSGKDVTALQTALTDIGSKLTDAGAQVKTALSLVTSLSPDQGDATVAAANHTALLSAHTDIKAAMADIQAIRKDIDTIIKGLRAFNSSTAKPKTAE